MDWDRTECKASTQLQSEKKEIECNSMLNLKTCSNFFAKSTASRIFLHVPYFTRFKFLKNKNNEKKLDIWIPWKFPKMGDELVLFCF